MRELIIGIFAAVAFASILGELMRLWIVSHRLFEFILATAQRQFI